MSSGSTIKYMRSDSPVDFTVIVTENQMIVAVLTAFSKISICSVLVSEVCKSGLALNFFFSLVPVEHLFTET